MLFSRAAYALLSFPAHCALCSLEGVHFFGNGSALKFLVLSMFFTLNRTTLQLNMPEPQSLHLPLSSLAWRTHERTSPSASFKILFSTAMPVASAKCDSHG